MAFGRLSNFHCEAKRFRGIGGVSGNAPILGAGLEIHASKCLTDLRGFTQAMKHLPHGIGRLDVMFHRRKGMAGFPLQGFTVA
jgi:hypothetical protein